MQMETPVEMWKTCYLNGDEISIFKIVVILQVSKS